MFIANVPDANSYNGYADLCRQQVPRKDFEINISSRPESSVAILAPHGGAIERGTSQIAAAIAGEQFNLYLFEGMKPSQNYETLHLTSHYFDEPSCLELISACSIVVTIHGCNGKEENIFLGGRNINLKTDLAIEFRKRNIAVQTKGHRYTGNHLDNICNRGLTRQGVQIELTDPLRGTPAEEEVINAVREVLLRL